MESKIVHSKIMYHVFTDGFDDWLSDKEKAISMGKQLASEVGRARVYEETDWDEVKEEFENEKCIFAKGSFPF